MNDQQHTSTFESWPDPPPRRKPPSPLLDTSFSDQFAQLQEVQTYPSEYVYWPLINNELSPAPSTDLSYRLDQNYGKLRQQDSAQLHSLQTLRSERTYLLSALSLENHRAMSLLQRISTLEVDILNSYTTHHKSKIRKQIGWLKCRFQSATRQEETIIGRLQAINYEMNSWDMIRSYVDFDQTIGGSQRASYDKQNGTTCYWDNRNTTQQDPTAFYHQFMAVAGYQGQVWQPQGRLQYSPMPNELAQGNHISDSPEITLRSRPETDYFGLEFIPTARTIHTNDGSAQQQHYSEMPDVVAEPELTKRHNGYSVHRCQEKPDKMESIIERSPSPISSWRRTSLNSIDLDLLNTNDPRTADLMALRMTKRNSLPSLPGLEKIWALPTHNTEDEKVEDVVESWEGGIARAKRGSMVDERRCEYLGYYIRGT